MRKIVLKYGGDETDLQHGSLTFGQGSLQVLWIILFSSLYLLRDIVGVSFPDIVFSGFCALIFLVADTGTALGLYMFTTALTVPHNEICIFYIVIMIVKLYMARKLRLNTTLLLATIGLFFLQLLDSSLFSTLGLGDFIYDYVVRMLPMLLPLFWFSADFSPTDYRRAMLCYTIGVILGGTVVLLLTANEVGWSALLQGTGVARLGGTVTESTVGMQTTYNANQLAGMFSIASAIVLIFMDKKWIPKIIGFALLGYSLFMILLTRSRTGILMLLLAVLVYYWILVVRKKKILRGVAIFAAMVLLVMVVVHLFPNLMQMVVDRFVDQDDITTGRTDLFVLYLSAWRENVWSFLFGYGIGSYQKMVDIWTSPHNSITDILICWGVVGLLLVSITLWKLLRLGRARVNKSERLIACLPALIAFVAPLGGQYLTTGFPHVRLCFLLLAASAFAKEIIPAENKGEVEL